MLITCPSCAAEYDVPGPLAPGRKVRCARCSSQWMPVPPAVPDSAVIAAVAEPVAVPPKALPPPAAAPKPAPIARPVVRLAPGRVPLLLAWAASVLVLAALVAAAYVWRGPVMQAWPPSVRLYGALGLTAHP